MVQLLRQSHDLRFERIGSLYFPNVADKVVGVDVGDGFVIGRIVSPWIFRDKRVAMDYPFFLKGIEVQEPPPVGAQGWMKMG